VEHGDFYSIMSTLSRHVERENDDNSGEIVREVERRCAFYIVVNWNILL